MNEWRLGDPTQKRPRIAHGALLAFLATAMTLTGLSVNAADPEPAPRLMVQALALTGAKASALSQDGKIIAIGSSRSNLTILETATGRLLCTLDGSADGAIALSLDGHRLVSDAGRSGMAIWDLDHCGEKKDLNLQTSGRVRSLRTLPDGRVLINDESAASMDVFGTAPVFPPAPSGPSVRTLALSTDGRYRLESVVDPSPPGTPVTLAQPAQLRVFDARAGSVEPIALPAAPMSTTHPPGGTREVRVGAVSPSGKWIAVETQVNAVGNGILLSHRLTLYDRIARRVAADIDLPPELPPASAADGVDPRQVAGVRGMFLTGQSTAPRLVSFSPDERRIYLLRPRLIDYEGRSRDMLVAFKRENLQPDGYLDPWEGRAKQAPMVDHVATFAPSGDGRSIAWVSFSGWGVWDIGSAAARSTVYAATTNAVESLAWTAEGDLLTVRSGSVDGRPSTRLNHWRLRTGDFDSAPLGPHSVMRDLATGGTRLAEALLSESGLSVRVIDTLSNTPLWQLKAEEISACPRPATGRPPLSALKLSDSGALLAMVWRQSGTLQPQKPTGSVGCLFDGGNGKFLGSWEAPTGLNRLAFSGDEQTLFVDGSTKVQEIKLSGPPGARVTAGQIYPARIARAGAASPPMLVLAAGGDRKPPPPELQTAPPIVSVGRDRIDWNPAAATLKPRSVVVTGAERSLMLYSFDASGAAPKLLQLTDHNAGIVATAFSLDGRFLASASSDGTTIIWDARSGARIANLYSFDDGTWSVVDPQGRFDTNNLDDRPRLHWVLPDDPLHALGIEIFMREYFEPRLLPRLLAGAKLDPVRGLSQLNRAQPIAVIRGIEPKREAPGMVDVTVEVRSTANAKGADGGLRDLRLFRNGQLVGFASTDAGARVPLKGRTATVTFASVRLPRDGKDVDFSAYAFNSDRIKGETDRRTLAAAAPAMPNAPRRAIVVAFGVGDYETPSWNLSFAANDARLIAATLEKRLAATRQFSEVISIARISSGAVAKATKADVRQVLSLLAGQGTASDDADLRRLSAVTPDDLVILAFSGHGFVGSNGDFFLAPRDIGPNRGGTSGADLQARSISSDELAAWFRDVDAGELAFVIDACYSAASVTAEGFKPGPMGSRGLGQMAYDKGMRVLAAAQADNVAIETASLQNGLLTYALAKEGIEQDRADWSPVDRKIQLDEWLRFGIARVPTLYADLKAPALARPRAATVATVTPAGSVEKLQANEQRPSLFDFTHRTQSPSIGVLP